MTENGNLERADMLRPDEVPGEVVGYDKALPDDILYRIRKQVLPFIESRYPRCQRPLEMWMYEINEVIESIDSRIDEPVATPMPRERLGISIVICTYNGATLLPDTLASIAALENDSGRDWELIVVDNASTDDTARVARESCPPQIRDRLTVLSEPRLGVVFARLKGLYNARYDIVSFIDDDNRPCTDWLDATARVLEARPEVCRYIRGSGFRFRAATVVRHGQKPVRGGQSGHRRRGRDLAAGTCLGSRVLLPQERPQGRDPALRGSGLDGPPGAPCLDVRGGQRDVLPTQSRRLEDLV